MDPQHLLSEDSFPNKRQKDGEQVSAALTGNQLLPGPTSCCEAERHQGASPGQVRAGRALPPVGNRQPTGTRMIPVF